MYATKQVQSGPGLGLRYMECTTTHAEHHGVFTSQVGQNNSFPWHTDHGTFYKVCRGPTAPVHVHGTASRMRIERQATSDSQPWP